MNFNCQNIFEDKEFSAQMQSINPKSSVWVSANAGSGKTYVLIRRIIRLLLSGVHPSQILCLTYTKSAAILIKTRIFNCLASWMKLNNKELFEEISSFQEKKCNERNLDLARALFNRVIEVPGGMKIQTIHSFCESILRQFPLEANIEGYFDVIDNLQQKNLVKEAKSLFLEGIWNNQNIKINYAFYKILQEIGEKEFEKFFDSIIKYRIHFNSYVSSEEKIKEIFREIFKLNKNITKTSLIKNLKKTILFSAKDMMTIFSYGGKNAIFFLEKIKEILSETDDKRIIKLCYQTYLKKGSCALRNPKFIFTKNIQNVDFSIIDKFLVKQKKVLSLIEELENFNLFKLNMFSYKIIKCFLNYYQNIKKENGFLDFDDLIYYTLSLLRKLDNVQWIQYKIDYDIRHLLIDEAQDTNPQQWEIIRLIAEPFFDDISKISDQTIFAVGDEKQCIYSFQGAISEDFSKHGIYFKNRAHRAKKNFLEVQLTSSFRSSKDILSAVDIIFSKKQNYKGLHFKDEPTKHLTKINESGYVEIWKFLEGKTRKDPIDWREQHNSLESPNVILAKQVAEKIKKFLHGNDQNIVSAQDIIVLVRKRGKFIHSLSRALKKYGISSSGSDRINFSNHIIVRDLISLGSFLLQPKDDLSLAIALKSPIFGIDEETLFLISANRKDTLWNSLKKQSKFCRKILKIKNELEKYQLIIDTMPIFEFFNKILSENHGRKKIISRFGLEANDILDIFLDYAISYQKRGIPGLRHFLETLMKNNLEIKRELDQSYDEVRIMTVHSAKGLEAKVVFLIDCGEEIWNKNNEKKFFPMLYNQKEILIWNPKLNLKIDDSCIDKILKNQSEKEYRRLLYVGMTRSKNYLIVCGYRSKNKCKNTWLSIASNLLIPYAKPITSPAKGVIAWRYQITQKNQYQCKIVKDENNNNDFNSIPGFLKTKLKFRKISLPLLPSEAFLNYKQDFNFSPVLSENNLSDFVEFNSTFRGNIIHHLLQYLPNIKKSIRKKITLEYLQKIFPNWKYSKCQDFVMKIFSIVEDKCFSSLFSRKSRSEVSIMGEIVVSGKKRIISGKMDRIAIFDDKVFVADFKSGNPPENINSIPYQYGIQLSLYNYILEKIYPKKEIIPILIYVQKPNLIKLDKTKLYDLITTFQKNN